MNNLPTILYVDDEPLNLMLFDLNFKNKYKVILGNSGMEGLELLSRHPEVKIVFSDMRMPGINGIEFIKQAKKLHPELYYYILTGYEINEEISAALNNQTIRNYFRKPFMPDDIERELIKVLNNN